MTNFDITIQSANRVAMGWLTDSPVTPSGGYGGHPTAARPKRAALTIYEGRNPFTLSVPMLLYRGVSANSKGQEESVEKDRKALEAMATTRGEAEAERPESVSISTRFPLPIADTVGSAWWIEDLAWGEERRNSPDLEVDPGHLVWKLVTVTLLERNDDETLGQDSSNAPKLVNKPVSKYKVKKGDTLHSIAKSQLQNATRWEEVGKLNGIRSDGQLAAKVGKYIKIPATTPAGFAQPSSK
jgi:LysM repeat protein